MTASNGAAVKCTVLLGMARRKGVTGGRGHTNSDAGEGEGRKGTRRQRPPRRNLLYASCRPPGAPNGPSRNERSKQAQKCPRGCFVRAALAFEPPHHFARGPTVDGSRAHPPAPKPREKPAAAPTQGATLRVGPMDPGGVCGACPLDARNERAHRQSVPGKQRHTDLGRRGPPGPPATHPMQGTVEARRGRRRIHGCGPGPSKVAHPRRGVQLAENTVVVALGRRRMGTASGAAWVTPPATRCAIERLH